MKNLIILAGLVIIFLFDISIYFSSNNLNEYIYEYFFVDVLSYILIFIIYILLCKKSRYDFNVKFIPVPFYAGVMSFLVAEELLYKNFREYTIAIKSVLLYNHYGIIAASGAISIIFFILNRKYYMIKETDNELEKKYKMIRVEEDSIKNKIFVGVEYYKTLVVGFISGIIVIIFKLIYYTLMKGNI